jgi:Cytochrome c7 and related cytochrome c
MGWRAWARATCLLALLALVLPVGGSLFNHDTDTRYPLRGKHRTLACTNCHTGLLYRQKTASDCYGCHRQDDKHQGSLGRECASCHTERDWKERAKFNHGKTAFPLLGRHADTE